VKGSGAILVKKQKQSVISRCCGYKQFLLKQQDGKICTVGTYPVLLVGRVVLDCEG